LRSLHLLGTSIFTAVADEQPHLDELPAKSRDILVEFAENGVDFGLAIYTSLFEDMNHMTQQDLALLAFRRDRLQASSLDKRLEDLPFVVVAGCRSYLWHFGQKCVLRPATFTRLISVPQT